MIRNRLKEVGLSVPRLYKSLHLLCNHREIRVDWLYRHRPNDSLWNAGEMDHSSTSLNSSFSAQTEGAEWIGARVNVFPDTCVLESDLLGEDS